MAFPVTQAIPAETSQGGASERVCRFIAGLDTGVTSSLLFLCWLIFHSVMREEYWWTKLNVLGGLFYGDAVFEMGFGRASVAGAALVLATYGLLGGVFGLFARTRGVALNLLVGLGLALLWHGFATRYVWRVVYVFAPHYFPSLGILPGHLMFGLFLSRFSSRFAAVARSIGDPVWAATYLRVPESLISEPVAPSSPDSDAPPEEEIPTPVAENPGGEPVENSVPRDNPDETPPPDDASRDC